jgi:hypothetical protein
MIFYCEKSKFDETSNSLFGHKIVIKKKIMFTLA